MKKVIFSILIFCYSYSNANPDSLIIRKIYDEALENGECYQNLRSLCKDVGARLSGSPQADQAVEWAKKLMESYGFDKVWLQEVMVPVWQRESEKCEVELKNGKSVSLNIITLGGSVAGEGEISAPVIEVKNFEELEKLGENHIKGKIVFFNHPFDPKYIETFRAYSSCVGYRFSGASNAAKYGAKAVIIRSMTEAHDNFPHTGVMAYKEDIPKIPAVAIASNHADSLHQWIKNSQVARINLEVNCRTLPDKKSYNVIGEITGATKPDEIILVGGHLDSWDVGEGAHDDGAGCVQSVEVLRIFKKLGIKPKHTIRAVLFMNEENGNRGGKTYAEQAALKNEKHIAAIESDRGGFTPRGFSFDSDELFFEKIKSFQSLFKPYLIHYFEKGYGGVDISPLKKQGVPLIGFVPDSQRYFDFHHTKNDVFENVHERELELGSATIATLVYLIDKYF